MLSLPSGNTAVNTSTFVISEGSKVLSGKAVALFGQAGGGIQWWIGLLQGDFMIEQLKKILIILENEIVAKNSFWDKEVLLKVIKPEMKELYRHFISGEKFFKYGKTQRMLESTYIITDSIKNLGSTNLGKEILKLQNMYYNI